MIFNLPEVKDAFDEYELALMDTVEHLKSELNAIARVVPILRYSTKLRWDYYGAAYSVESDGKHYRARGASFTDFSLGHKHD